MTMDHKNQACIIPEIPADILVEILVRLPSIYITRCKGVSKVWNTLISDDSFPGTKLLNSPLMHLIGVYKNYHLDDLTFSHFYKVFVDHITGAKDKSSIITTPLELSFLPSVRTSKDRFAILDSCNGLVLCMINMVSFFVINYSNKTWLQLPLPPTNLVEKKTFPSTLAFYPEISDHFKVVWTVPFKSHVRLVIFSSQSGLWVASELVAPVDKTFYNHTNLYCPMLFSHDIAYTIDDGSEYIAQFNVRAKTVDLIELPEGVSLPHVSQLLVREGRLLWFGVSFLNDNFQVWEREVQNSSTANWAVKHSFPKQFMFDGLMFTFGTITCMRACLHPNKDAIFIRFGTNYIVYYEFDTQKKKLIELEGCEWSRMLLPLSSCLVNLFEVRKSWFAVLIAC